MGTNEHLPKTSSPVDDYPTTNWSHILAAKDTDSTTAQAALERLCQRYHPAITCYFRVKLGNANAAENAEDLAQSFFTDRWIEKNFFRGVDRDRAPRFRHYLAACLANFFKDWLRQRQAQRNSGGQAPLPIAHPGISGGVDLATPDAGDQNAVDEAVALHIHGIVRQKLEHQTEPQERWSRLNQFILMSPEPGDYAKVAAELNMSVDNVKTTVRRWRSRYAHLFHQEIAAVVEVRAGAVAEESEALLKLVLRASERGEVLW